MWPFSKAGLNQYGSVIIQLVSGSGEAQDLKLVNYVLPVPPLQSNRMGSFSDFSLKIP
ncbi:MAG: hypothetical protein GY797_05680 [Deltaproteobacteria bacterium]|nr:hypothetical protein [Deltaproteobacteria bacterium]